MEKRKKGRKVGGERSKGVKMGGNEGVGTYSHKIGPNTRVLVGVPLC